jgi:hypothetical protein
MNAGTRPIGALVVCALLAWSLLVDLARWPFLLHGLGTTYGAGWFDRAAAGLLMIGPFFSAPSLVAVWRLRRWAHKAVAAWAAITSLQAGRLLYLVAGLGGARGAEWAIVCGAWIAVAVALGSVALYVRRLVRRRRAGTSPSGPSLPASS